MLSWPSVRRPVKLTKISCRVHDAELILKNIHTSRYSVDQRPRTNFHATSPHNVVEPRDRSHRSSTSAPPLPPSLTVLQRFARLHSPSSQPPHPLPEALDIKRSGECRNVYVTLHGGAYWHVQYILRHCSHWTRARYYRPCAQPSLPLRCFHIHRARCPRHSRPRAANAISRSSLSMDPLHPSLLYSSPRA